MMGFTSLMGIIGDYNDNHMWGGGWAWLAMTLMMVLGAAVIGVVVWVIVRGSQHRPVSDLESARAILAERLARGDITPEEYRERLQHLQ